MRDHSLASANLIVRSHTRIFATNVLCECERLLYELLPQVGHFDCAPISFKILS